MQSNSFSIPLSSVVRFSPIFTDKIFFALNFMKSLKQVQKRSLILADKPRLLPSIPFRLVGNKVYTKKKLHIL